MPRPSVSAGLWRGLLEFAATRGAHVSDLIERSGIDPGLLQDDDNRIPLPMYASLMSIAKEATGDPALGLHFGESVGVERVSIVGLISQASATMYDAFVQLNRYGRLVVDVGGGTEDRFRMDSERGELWLVDTRPNPNEFPELTESAFAQLVCGPRRLGVPPVAQAVHFTHPEPSYRSEYERIFAAPVFFERPRNALKVDERLATYRIAALPSYAFGVLADHADALLAELENPKTTRAEVESLLLPILHTGGASMGNVAEQMSVSRQTLFRRLKFEGVTFERVLDELRREMALRYLTGSKTSVNETAYLVGFSDPTAFSRAFKRWTGVNPREIRYEN